MSHAINVAWMVHAQKQQTHVNLSSHDVFFSHVLKDFNHTCTKNYGYQATQEIIDILVDNDDCDWIVTTNGDNLFDPLFFENTGVVDEESAGIIGFDFISHHLRPASNGQTRMNQHIAVAMVRGHVDLSSVLLRRKMLAECPSAKFFPSCDDVDFAQDWVVLDKLLTDCNAAHRVVPEVLLFHN